MHFIANVFDKLQIYVPLFQTMVWPLFLSIFLIVFRRHICGILETLRKRIERGSSIKAGPVEIGPELKALDYAQPSSASDSTDMSVSTDWEQERTSIYRDNHGIFLVHVIAPSCSLGMKYDVFIYLKKHKTTDLSDIDHADFFFGHMWGNNIYSEKPKNDVIGVSTSAYGPFLCTCRAYMKNGDVVRMNRYIDFEMGSLIEGSRS